MGNFSEVQRPLTMEEAMAEADRCVQCAYPICMEVCPLQTDLRGMCEAVASGDFARAYHRIRETNALLGTTARCCPQLQGLCEEACNVGSQGQPVATGMIQRFVADWERNQKRQPDPEVMKDTGKKVAVVGGGPAGLAASELLRRYGHSVTIHEELPQLGGTAAYAIPDYHLPKDVLDYEVQRILGMGVEVKTGVKIGRDVTLAQLEKDYDAVLVATGAKDVAPSETPGSDLRGVIDGYRFLEEVFGRGVDSYMWNPTYDLGKDVLVIGGGNSAVDCARTAQRLTNGKVIIVYRRTEAEMPADPIVIQEAQEEGVDIQFLVAPKTYNGTDGKLVSATMSIMKLGAVDSSGRRSPVPTGEEEVVKCDSVLIAIGRGPDTFVQKKSGLKTAWKGSIAVDDHSRTSDSKVFAAGDVVTGETLVVKAMAKGREAAQRVHEYLMNLEDEHMSLYDYYFVRRTSGKAYRDMLDGNEERLPPS